MNVFAFLRNTEEMQRLTRVRGMTIKCQDRDTAGRCRCSVAMNIYFAAE